eukprot:COSAG06_NODE_7981_length_2312_cov_5.610120_2_plen_413_part_00
MADLAAETVAERLRDRAARSETLAALESHAAPIPTAVSLAAAPALLGLMAMDAVEVERDTYDRAGLLLARLEAEALPDVVAVHGAAFGEGGYERLWNADSVLNTALRQPAAQLTRADAMSCACYAAYDPIYPARGFTEPFRAAGITTPEFVGLWMGAEPLVSKKKLPEDDVPTKMLTLLVELLKANELPELAIGGAWTEVVCCVTGRPSMGPVALKHGVVELAAEHLKAIGSPADWVSISRGKAGRAYMALRAVSDMCKAFSGDSSRPDLAACVASGLFDLCLEAITAVAVVGVDGLQDAHHYAVYCTSAPRHLIRHQSTQYLLTRAIQRVLTSVLSHLRPCVHADALSLVRTCRAQPGCEGRIRSASGALAFHLMNDLDCCVDLGVTTGACAAQICENPRAAVSRSEAHTA